MTITFKAKLLKDGTYSVQQWNPYKKQFIHLYKVADYASAEWLMTNLHYKYA